LDRRRFEDGFILFTVGKICRKYDIEINVSITDRNSLLNDINERFYDAFVKRWGGENFKIFNIQITYISGFRVV